MTNYSTEELTKVMQERNLTRKSAIQYIRRQRKAHGPVVTIDVAEIEKRALADLGPAKVQNLLVANDTVSNAHKAVEELETLPPAQNLGVPSATPATVTGGDGLVKMHKSRNPDQMAAIQAKKDARVAAKAERKASKALAAQAKAERKASKALAAQAKADAKAAKAKAKADEKTANELARLKAQDDKIVERAKKLTARAELKAQKAERKAAIKAAKAQDDQQTKEAKVAERVAKREAKALAAKQFKEAKAIARAEKKAAREAAKANAPASVRKSRNPGFDAAKAVELYKAGSKVVDIAVALGYAKGQGQNRVRAALTAAGVYVVRQPKGETPAAQ